MEEFNQLHIGKIIRQELRNQGRSNVWLAKQLACHPRTIDKIFQKQFIDSYQLFRISKALQHDFFKYYSKFVQCPN